MPKDKCKKRRERRRLIRGEMTKRGIVAKEIAARLGISGSAVCQGCATAPRIVAALIEAGVPARWFGDKAPAPAPQPAATGGEGEKEKAA